jgi:hypothetical protein
LAAWLIASGVFVMVSNRAMIRVLMVRLVEKAGGVDAASALISARLDCEVGKGTISKRMAGHLEWPLVEIMALEDAVDDTCVRRWLAGSMPEAARAQSIMVAAAHSALEHGQAVAAALAVAGGKGDMAVARRELGEAAQALSGLLAALDAQGGAT